MEDELIDDAEDSGDDLDDAGLMNMADEGKRARLLHMDSTPNRNPLEYSPPYPNASQRTMCSMKKQPTSSA